MTFQERKGEGLEGKQEGRNVLKKYVDRSTVNIFGLLMRSPFVDPWNLAFTITQYTIILMAITMIYTVP